MCSLFFRVSDDSGTRSSYGRPISLRRSRAAERRVHPRSPWDPPGDRKKPHPGICCLDGSSHIRGTRATTPPPLGTRPCCQDLQFSPCCQNLRVRLCSQNPEPAGEGLRGRASHQSFRTYRMCMQEGAACRQFHPGRHLVMAAARAELALLLSW